MEHIAADFVSWYELQNLNEPFRPTLPWTITITKPPPDMELHYLVPCPLPAPVHFSEGGLIPRGVFLQCRWKPDRTLGRVVQPAVISMEISFAIIDEYDYSRKICTHSTGDFFLSMLYDF